MVTSREIDDNILWNLRVAHHTGKGPLSAAMLRRSSRMSSYSAKEIRAALDRLNRDRLVLPALVDLSLNPTCRDRVGYMPVDMFSRSGAR